MRAYILIYPADSFSTLLTRSSIITLSAIDSNMKNLFSIIALILFCLSDICAQEFHDAVLNDVHNGNPKSITYLDENFKELKKYEYFSDGRLNDSSCSFEYDENGYCILKRENGILFITETSYEYENLVGVIVCTKEQKNNMSLIHNYSNVTFPFPESEVEAGAVLGMMSYDELLFSRYVVDEKGNWVSRTVTDDSGKKYTEHRKIVYWDDVTIDWPYTDVVNSMTPPAVDFRQNIISVHPGFLLLYHFGWINPSASLEEEVKLLRQAGADPAFWTSGYRKNDVEVVYGREYSAKSFVLPNSDIIVKDFVFCVDSEENGKRVVNYYFKFYGDDYGSMDEANKVAEEFLDEMKAQIEEITDGEYFDQISDDPKRKEQSWRLDTPGARIDIGLEYNVSHYYVFLIMPTLR